MKEWIILIIALIISAISASIKNKKARTAHKTTNPQYDADPWDNIPGKNNNEKYETPTKNNNTIKTQKIGQTISLDLNSRFKSDEVIQENSDVAESKTDIEIEDIDNTNLNKRFNIRDAVIYSEILKPKF